MIENITIGSDPEFFLFSELETKFISAIDMFPGDKQNPHKITEEGHAIQVDGIGCEFNIPPCTTADDFHKEIKFVMDYMNDTIIKPKGLLISPKASALFKADQLNDKRAWEIGCSPDINAWTLDTNNPKEYVDKMRAVGGHVAVGYTNPDAYLSFEMIKAMDLFLGVPSVLLDKDTKRRELYGKAGAMRITPFGLEYRVLSNFWIFDEVLTKWVFDNTIKAAEFINIQGFISNPEEIQECINTGNKKLALEIIDDYKIEIPTLNRKEEYDFA